MANEVVTPEEAERVFNHYLAAQPQGTQPRPLAARIPQAAVFVDQGAGNLVRVSEGGQLTTPTRENSINEVPYGVTGEQPTFWGGLLSLPHRGLGWLMDTVGLDSIGNDFYEAGDKVQRGVDQFTRNLTTGVLAIPGDIGGIAGLAGAGLDFLGDRIFHGQQNDFASYMFRDGGQQALEDNVQRVADTYLEAFPNATQEELNTVLTQYQNGDEFANLVMQQLRPGLSLSAQINAWAAQAAGQTRRPDQMTALDEAEQLIGAAFVGLPTGMARAIAGRLSRGYIEEILRNRAVRGVIRAGEAVTPLTLPLTPANVAINAGAGLAINELLRDTGNMTGMIDDAPDTAGIGNEVLDQLVDAEDVPTYVNYMSEDDGGDVRAHDEAFTLGAEGALAALFGVAFGRTGHARTFIDAGATQAQQAIDRNIADVAAGNPETFLQPGLDRGAVGSAAQSVNRTIDNQAVIREAVRSSTGSRDVVDDIEADMGTSIGVSGDIEIDNWLRRGIGNGLTYRFPSVRLFREMLSSLDVKTQDLFQNYVFARQARDDRTVSMDNVNDEIAKLQVQLGNAMTTPNSTRTQNSLIQQINDLQAQRQQLQADTPGSRPNLEAWDNNTINSIINAGQANSDVMNLTKAYREMTDALLDYQLKNGYITLDEFNKMRGARTIYAPLKEYPFTAVNPKTGKVEPVSGLRAASTVWRNRLKPDNQKNDLTGFSPKAERDLSVDKSKTVKVNNPINPVDALELHIRSTIRDVQTNRVRRDIIDQLMGSAWKDKHIRQYKNGNTKQFTAAQIRSGRVPGLQEAMRAKNALTVKRDGYTEIYEFGDQALRDALEFAPPMLFRPLNVLRKVWQNGTTGKLAPWFAPKAAVWETMSGALLRREGRSFGLMDAMVRKFTRDNASLGWLADPTAIFQTMAAIPRQLLWRTYGAAGQKLADELAKNSPTLNALATMLPGGKPMLQRIAGNMVRAFDQSAMGVLMHHNFGNTSFMVDPHTVKTSYDKFVFPPGTEGHLRRAGRRALQAYSTMLDSVHNSAKYAFFAQNYAILKRQAKGKQIDRKKLTRLVNDTRQLSGDMSRLGSDGYNKLTSAIPYSNVAVQATRHVISEIGRHPIQIGTRLASGLFIPAAAMTYMMSNWDDDAREYWWNQVPTWQRISSLPVPTADTVWKWVQGEYVPFTPDAIQLVPIAPEFIPLNQAFVAGLNGLGIGQELDLVRGQRVPTSFLDEMRVGMGTLTNLAMPPAINALLAAAGQQGSIGDLIAGGGIRDVPEPTFAGINADQINVNSEIPRKLYDVIGALMGTASEIGMQMVDGFQQTDAQFSTAVEKALEIGGFEVQRRVSDVPLLFNNRNSLYKFTPVSEEVYDFNQMIQGVLDQRVVENDSKNRQQGFARSGIEGIPTIQDPLIAAMVEETHNAFARGQWIDMRDELANLNSILTAVDGNVSTVPAATRSVMRDAVIRQYQMVQEQQLNYINEYNATMEQRYGDQFSQQFGMNWSPEAFVQVVDAVTQQPQ